MVRKMTDSGLIGIDEIPESWNVVKVKEVFSIGRGRVIAKTELNDEGLYPVYSSQTKNDGCLGYIDTYDYEEPQLTWTTDGANAGTVFLRTGKYNCTNVCGTLLSKTDENDLKYLKYVLEHVAVYHKRADINGYKIMNNEMADIKVPLPSIKVQQKVANFLDYKTYQIDSIIQNTKLSIEEFKSYKQALIIETITKGVNSEVEMKGSGINWIGDIPKDWHCSKIKYVTSISRGKFSHRPRNDERYYDGDYPFIQTGDVARANKYVTSYSQSLNELGKGVSKEFPKGTLVMTIAANIGDVAVLDFDSYFPDSIIGFVPNNGFYWNYLYYIFCAMKETFISTAIVSTQLNLNVERVKELFIPVTRDEEEQREIADYLDEKCAHIDSLIEQKQQLIKEFENYKKSLIYEYVTGKKEVL